MKKLFAFFTAIVMVFAFTNYALADGIPIGGIDDSNYDKYIFEAPNAGSYQITYTAADPAMTKIGQRMVRTVGAISGIRIECTGVSESHDIQLEIYPVLGGSPIVSQTYHTDPGETHFYNVNWTSTSENIYNVKVTHPEGTDGIVDIYFMGTSSSNHITEEM